MAIEETVWPTRASFRKHVALDVVCNDLDVARWTFGCHHASHE